MQQAAPACRWRRRRPRVGVLGPWAHGSGTPWPGCQSHAMQVTQLIRWCLPQCCMPAGSGDGNGNYEQYGDNAGTSHDADMLKRTTKKKSKGVSLVGSIQPTANPVINNLSHSRAQPTANPTARPGPHLPAFWRDCVNEQHPGSSVILGIQLPDTGTGMHIMYILLCRGVLHQKSLGRSWQSASTWPARKQPRNWG